MMFCPNCGAQLQDGTKFCPSCGSPVSVQGSFNRAASDFSSAAGNAFDGAKQMFNESAKTVDSAVQEFGNDFNRNGGYTTGQALKTDRSLLAYVLLSMITCGIYGYYFIYSVARDVNVACPDNEDTAGLGMFILLSFLTCGFYGVYWQYKLGNRIQANGPAYNLYITENGTTIVMWLIFGSLLCGIGSFIGTHILIKNVNTICAAYNKAHGLQ